MRVRVYLCLFLFISFSIEAREYIPASPPVALENPVYDDLELLESHKLIKGVIHGRRPFTAAEIGRLITSARQEFLKITNAEDSRVVMQENELKKIVFSEKTRAFLDDLLTRLENRYVSDQKTKGDIYFLKEGTIDATLLQSPQRSYTGTGIQAFYQPLTQNRGGRKFTDGFQHSFETRHGFSFTSHLSGEILTRFQLQWSTTEADNENRATLQEGTINFSFLNNQIDIGRRPFGFGQSRFGGLVISNNARPIDQIVLFNQTPWKIWKLGHISYTFFLGTLGPEQNFNYPLISGGHLSYKPFEFLELGAMRALVFGGTGAPSASFWQMFREWWGDRGRGNSRAGGGPNISNSVSGIEFRAKIPPLRNLEIYGEAYFDDFNPAHIIRGFTQDAFLLGGLSLARLDDAGTMSLNLEARKSAFIMYRHNTWSSGWTLNGFMLGDPLGGDAETFHSRFVKRWQAGKTKLTHDLFLERIDSDLYRGTGDPGRMQTFNGPPEWRIRNLVQIDHDLSETFTLSGQLGYEYVKDFNFTPGRNENNFLFGTKLTIRPGDRFHFVKNKY